MTQETELPASLIDEIVLRVVYDGDASIPYREDWMRGIGLPFARAIERAAVLAERERLLALANSRADHEGRLMRHAAMLDLIDAVFGARPSAVKEG